MTLKSKYICHGITASILTIETALGFWLHFLQICPSLCSVQQPEIAFGLEKPRRLFQERNVSCSQNLCMVALFTRQIIHLNPKCSFYVAQNYLSTGELLIPEWLLVLLVFPV